LIDFRRAIVVVPGGSTGSLVPPGVKHAQVALEFVGERAAA